MSKRQFIQIPKFVLPAPNSRAIYESYKQQAELALSMQTRGLHIDQAKIKHHIGQISARRDKFMSILTLLTGISRADLGNDGNTKLLKTWFLEKCGAESLNTKEVLLPLLDHPEDAVRDAAAALIGFRKASKALTMLDAYGASEVVYPSWNVTGTKGSRWSCSDPNIMQLPAHDVKYGFPHGIELVAQSLKDIIIPRPGYVFVGSDYSALELYLQTYIAGAKTLLEWIAKGEDLHMNNARIFFGPALPANATKKTHKSHREVGKLAFGFSYNVSDHVTTVWKQMRSKIPEVTMEWVQEARKRYFALHTEFPAWQERTKAQIDEHGYIELGLLRRRLYLESSTRGYNQAMNSQCQTLGGDVMTAAVLQVTKKYDVALTWYDSIILEVPNDPALVKDVAAELQSAMEGPFPVNGLQAKFVAEPDMGPNLKDMTPVI